MIKYRHFTDDIFKCIFLKGSCCILKQISQFSPKLTKSDIQIISSDKLLSFWTCFGKHKKYFEFSIISRLWDDLGPWISSPWKTMMPVFYQNSIIMSCWKTPSSSNTQVVVMCGGISWLSCNGIDDENSWSPNSTIYQRRFSSMTHWCVKIFIQWNIFGNVVCEMATILFLSQWITTYHKCRPLSPESTTPCNNKYDVIATSGYCAVNIITGFSVIQSTYMKYYTHKSQWVVFRWGLVSVSFARTNHLLNYAHSVCALPYIVVVWYRSIILTWINFNPSLDK